MAVVLGLVGLVVVVGLGACPADAVTGGDAGLDAVLVPDTVDAASAEPDVGRDVGPEVAPDAEPDSAIVEPDAEPDTAPDVEADTDQDIASDTESDTGPDAALPAVVTCPVPSLEAQYPPPFPPFPYGAWPEATGCLGEPHDVVIVLGCPSEGDGAPSACQTKRAEMADQLYEAGLASHFIVTGAAVHNSWVEAEALNALLIGRGIPAEAIVQEPLAQHTDENIYYSTRIMEARGWLSAIVVSEDPGHLMFTGLCDADCCVALGRMTLLQWPVGGVTVVKGGHYVLAPHAAVASASECSHIGGLAMCVNQDQRKACKDDFRLELP